MELPDVPESLRFSVRLRTRWRDEDNQGVLNNAVHSTLLEESRLAYFRELGLMDRPQFPFVLAQTNIAFLAPGRGGAEVVVECGTTHLGRTSFCQAYRIRSIGPSGEPAAPIAIAEARLVLVDATGASCPMTDEFRRRVAEHEG